GALADSDQYHGKRNASDIGGLARDSAEPCHSDQRDEHAAPAEDVTARAPSKSKPPKASAMALPQTFPYRDLIVLTAFSVVLEQNDVAVLRSFTRVLARPIP
ncbi:MAG: hypothetical protein ACXWC1_26395, partial [Burkholderiales bacterium]